MNEVIENRMSYAMERTIRPRAKRGRLRGVLTAFVVVLVLCWIARYMLYERWFPIHYYDTVSEVAAQYNADPLLILSVIKAESGFERTAVSHRDAMGLMQLTESTAEWCAAQMGAPQGVDLHDERTNIALGTWYFAHYLYGKYGDLDTVLAAYNAGPGNVDKWLDDTRYSSDAHSLDNIPYPETHTFVKRVKLYYAIYQLLYY